MNIDYIYYKRRAAFGRYCAFFNEGPTLVDNVTPNKALESSYIIKNPVNKGTQKSCVVSSHEANTTTLDFVDCGMYHDQGGWPKDLNILDEEAVLRYRKRLEREDNYIESMRSLSKPIEHAILQNNAINIYEQYFDNYTKQYSNNEYLVRLSTVFRDHSGIQRTISHLSWSPIGATAFAASYCNTSFRVLNSQENCESYIWNTEIPNTPQVTFDSKIPIIALEWNPMDREVLTGGLYNGQVALYDMRKSPEHVQISADVVSHRDPVHSVLWINSKAGVEFFSTSADGVVKWWDCRKLSNVLDSIILDVSKQQNIKYAYGASCLEFDSSIPAKYLVGTETGHVICGNRKGLTPAEKLPWIMKTHSGPVYSLQRNAGFSKFYLTIGDWSARVWSEDCKESPIFWTKHYKAALTAGEWSKGRYSVFFVTTTDGYIDLWDLLLEQRFPFVRLKLGSLPMSSMRVDETGQFAMVGDEGGKCYLVQYAEELASCGKNDKANLSSMLERDSRREKTLETRNREIRLAMKLKTKEEDKAPKDPAAESEEITQRAEEEYWEPINKVLGIDKKEKTEEG